MVENTGKFQTKRLVIKAIQTDDNSWFVRLGNSAVYLTDNTFNELFEKEYVVEIQD
jgi:hypothetical protein